MKSLKQTQSGMMQVLNQMAERSKGKDSAKLELFSSFERKDFISGSVKVIKGAIKLGN